MPTMGRTRSTRRKKATFNAATAAKARNEGRKDLSNTAKTLQLQIRKLRDMLFGPRSILSGCGGGGGG